MHKICCRCFLNSLAPISNLKGVYLGGLVFDILGREITLVVKNMSENIIFPRGYSRTDKLFF